MEIIRRGQCVLHQRSKGLLRCGGRGVRRGEQVAVRQGGKQQIVPVPGQCDFGVSQPAAVPGADGYTGYLVQPMPVRLAISCNILVKAFGAVAQPPRVHAAALVDAYMLPCMAIAVQRQHIGTFFAVGGKEAGIIRVKCVLHNNVFGGEGFCWNCLKQRRERPA